MDGVNGVFVVWMCVCEGWPGLAGSWSSLVVVMIFALFCFWLK